MIVRHNYMHTPRYPNTMACLVGAGDQIASCYFLTLIEIIIFSFFTLWRPYFYTIIMVNMAICGFRNGFTTARYHKYFGTTDWKFSGTVSALALPCFFMSALGLDRVLSGLAASPIRESFGDAMIRAIVWFVFNGIMCFGGALTGYYRKADDAIPNLDVDTRDIPDAPYHTRFFLLAPLSGLIQFLAIYTELSYLVESIFMSQIYAMFIFLFLSSCVQVRVI